MRLFRGYLQNKFLSLVQNNVKVKFIGDPTPIARDLRFQMKKLERATAKNNGLKLNVALNYGGRDEIVRACKKIAKKTALKEINLRDINETTFEKFLDTSGQKGPDIIIRTAGEQRLSNFLLWQAAYSEFYYTNLTWPEFTANDLSIAIDELSERNRTFGNIKSQNKG